MYAYLHRNFWCFLTALAPFPRPSTTRPRTHYQGSACTVDLFYQVACSPTIHQSDYHTRYSHVPALQLDRNTRVKRYSSRVVEWYRNYPVLYVTNTAGTVVNALMKREYELGETTAWNPGIQQPRQQGAQRQEHAHENWWYKVSSTFTRAAENSALLSTTPVVVCCPTSEPNQQCCLITKKQDQSLLVVKVQGRFKCC